MNYSISCYSYGSIGVISNLEELFALRIVIKECNREDISSYVIFLYFFALEQFVDFKFAHKVVYLWTCECLELYIVMAKKIRVLK